MLFDTSVLFSFPAIPLPHSRPWRPVGSDGRCAAISDTALVTRQSYLLDRFFADDANPLLRNWINDRFMLEPHSPWPLVLYGSAGVGKTLLAETLVRRISKNYRYTTGSDFRRQFIDACETRSIRRFQDHFTDGDVLLIDNLTAPAGETSLESEWVRLFDSYIENNRPFLVTAQTAPFCDERLSPALRSRLSVGLSIAVQSPGHVARQAITEQLLVRYGLAVESSELEWLAEQLPGTVPALSRELSRIALSAQSTLISSTRVAGGPFGREQLDELIDRKQLELDVRRFGILLRLVSRRFKLKGADIIGQGRQRQRVKARGVVVWLARNCFRAPYSRIGLLLGKRDASTMRHAFDCVERQRSSDSRLEKLLQELARNIENRITGDNQNALA